jgi:hypothetical protein
MAQDSTALVPLRELALDVGPYDPPRPGRTWRASVRSVVLVGGSVAIGAGVALGWFGIAPALMLAVALATGQVVAQSLHQNRLGQDVMGGIAQGDLGRALAAAESALRESPAGAMRTLAAANLASVLMQIDRVAEGAAVLDAYPPRWPHVPVATVLWNNNRAFAALAHLRDYELADRLLDDAEARLVKAGVRGIGGAHNFRKIGAALAGTRAMQRLLAGDAKGAMASLERSSELDDGIGSSFRVVERELVRGEALRRLGHRDEAVLVATALFDLTLTPRQKRALEALESRLGMPQRPGELVRAASALATDDDDDER